MNRSNVAADVLRRPWDGRHFLVAQISNLLYRRLPVGKASNSTMAARRASVARRFETCDTADWKSALLAGAGTVAYPTVQAVTPPVENLLVVLLSDLNDGTFFFTSNQRPKFKNPPGILNNRLVGGSPVQLIESYGTSGSYFFMKRSMRSVGLPLLSLYTDWITSFN